MIMGRRTFESLVNEFGGPLPDRRLLIVTSRGKIEGYPNIETFPDPEAALAAAQEAPRVFIGGGATIYKQFLERADRWELTIVEGNYQGDTYFPRYEHLIGTVFRKTGEDRRDGFRFVTCERIHTPQEDRPVMKDRMPQEQEPLEGPRSFWLECAHALLRGGADREISPRAALRPSVSAHGRAAGDAVRSGHMPVRSASIRRA